MSETTAPVLLVRAGGRVCALALGDVVETMRPLPTIPLAGTPQLVLGAAVVRGEPAPVVHLGLLLGGVDSSAPTRFVLLRCGARRALLAVDEVLGVAALDGAAPAPPLFDGAAAGAIEALSRRDAELALVLASARLVPEGTWAALARGAAPAQEQR